MTPPFALTWDYRCPFARIASDLVVTGLLDGADWDVQFVPFSLGQAHVEEGDPDIWDTPERDSGLLALQAAVIVRDIFPDEFPGIHKAIFDARHKQGARIDDEEVLRHIVDAGGASSTVVFERVAKGEGLEIVRKEHEAAVANHGVWGVPTFIVGTRATFVRLMKDSDGDGPAAIATVERVIDLMADWPDLNEFKNTSVER